MEVCYTIFMNETLMANIFFIITGVAVIFVTVIWVMISLQIYTILRTVRKIAHSFDDEAEEFRNLITAIRKKITKKILG